MIDIQKARRLLNSDLVPVPVYIKKKWIASDPHEAFAKELKAALYELLFKKDCTLGTRVRIEDAIKKAERKAVGARSNRDITDIVHPFRVAIEELLATRERGNHTQQVNTRLFDIKVIGSDTCTIPLCKMLGIKDEKTAGDLSRTIKGIRQNKLGIESDWRGPIDFRILFDTLKKQGERMENSSLATDALALLMSESGVKEYLRLSKSWEP